MEICWLPVHDSPAATVTGTSPIVGSMQNICWYPSSSKSSPAAAPPSLSPVHGLSVASPE